MNQAETPAQKKRTFSAIKPSGILTLGNYLGAMKNWVTMQEEYDCIFAVADLHAITVRQEPADLRRQILTTCALILASGVDPEKTTLFIQSQVAEHSQLAWLLNCYAGMGELSRMTQYKDKQAKGEENLNAGLFTYPVLMAADILLYGADSVPVGEDQKQHIELCRTLAERFNHLYSPTFIVPEAVIPKTAARVRSLQDPAKKMSKSDANANAWISLLDKPEDILRKFRRAVTDSEAVVRRGESKDGINNLISIYCAVTGKTPEETEAEFEGKGYGEFKTAVGEAVAEALRPVREKYDFYMSDKAEMLRIYERGAEKARHIARKTLSKVMRKIGYPAQ